MFAIMFEISASMTQLNARVYAILETHSIKETGADTRCQRFHSLYENIRLRPSTRRRINGVFKFIHFGECFRIYAFTVSVFVVFVDGRPKHIKKFAFTSVFVYNRLRVDGALDCRIAKTNKDGVRATTAQLFLEIPAPASGHLRSSATAVNISRVTVNCFPFDVIVFAMLPAHGIWRETVSLLDIM